MANMSGSKETHHAIHSTVASGVRTGLNTIPRINKVGHREASVNVSLHGTVERSIVQPARDAVFASRQILLNTERRVHKGPVRNAAARTTSVTTETDHRVENGGLVESSYVERFVPVREWSRISTYGVEESFVEGDVVPMEGEEGTL